MPKAIRFSELIQKSGRPYAATLWTDPTRDPAFHKAVKENRVVTVKKETVEKDLHLTLFVAGDVFLIPVYENGKLFGVRHNAVLRELMARLYVKAQQPHSRLPGLVPEHLLFSDAREH